MTTGQRRPRAAITLAKQLQRQHKRGEVPTAIFSDLDGTLVLPGNGPASRKALRDVSGEARRQAWPLIVASGQRARDIAAAVADKQLPPFEAIIGTVGTELWVLQPDGSYLPDTNYAARVLAAGYDRRAVVRRTQQLIEQCQLAVRAAELCFQEPASEAAFLAGRPAPHQPYKVSCHFFALRLNDATDMADTFRAAFPKHKIVLCEEIMHNNNLPPNQPKKYCLDILLVSKADAVNYLIRSQGFQRGIVAGDSGNDVDMLLESPDDFVAVLVAGHTAEARVAVRNRLTCHGEGQLHYAGRKLVLIDTCLQRIPGLSIMLATRLIRAKHDDQQSASEQPIR